MVTYNKKAKRSKDGAIQRYIGKNRNGVPTKFRLGYDLKEADRRIKLIEALWAEVEATNDGYPTKFWKPAYLKAAKLIEKMGTPTLPKNGCYEMAEAYLARIGEISARTGVKFEPANASDLKMALAEIRDVVQESRNSLSAHLTSHQLPDKPWLKHLMPTKLVCGRRIPIPPGRYCRGPKLSWISSLQSEGISRTSVLAGETFCA